MVLAAKKRNWELVKLLNDELNACINIPTSSGWYVVHAAIEDNDLETLEHLMKKGVDIYGINRLKPTEEVNIILFSQSI